MRETKYKDMVWVNNELVSWGDGIPINVGLSILVFSSVTPFTNLVLYPIGLKLRKKKVWYRYEKGSLRNKIRRLRK